MLSGQTFLQRYADNLSFVGSHLGETAFKYIIHMSPHRYIRIKL